MSNAVYTGTFDPVTYGHLDIIQRASAIFDTLYVCILDPSGKGTMFSTEERMEMLAEVCQAFPNVKTDFFTGLTVEYAREKGIRVIVRGLRAVTEFERELQMAQMNRKIFPGVDTVFFTTSLKYAYLSSSTVREIAAYGGNIRQFVPDFVEERVVSALGNAAAKT